MKLPRTALALAALIVAAPRPAAAQPLSGFGTFSLTSDVNGQVFPGISGGVLLDVAGSWVSVGAQGDLLVSGVYFAGRGGPIVQVNVLRYRNVRLFALGGMAWGEEAGPVMGAGIDVWSRSRIGFRASVQAHFTQIAGFDCAFFGYDQAYCDANLHGGRPYTARQPSLQVGVIWR